MSVPMRLVRQSEDAGVAQARFTLSAQPVVVLSRSSVCMKVPLSARA